MNVKERPNIPLLFFRDQRGQVLPWMAMMMIMLIGLCGLTLDVARVMVIHRQLQSATNAAALAGAQQMPDGDYSGVAKSFGSGSGNSNDSLSYTAKNAVVTPLCVAFLKSQGLPCSGAAAANALQVQQTAAVPMLFAGLMGFKTLNITATATSAMRGSKPLPYNIAIILDTTPSMDYSDTNCGTGATQLSCAVGGIQQLLLNVSPSVDNVSLFTFPNITTTTTGNDYDCSTTNPTVGPYTFPSTTAKTLTNMNYKVGSTTVYETYQVTGFLADYRTDNQAKSLTTTSNLTKAVGGKSGCTGIQTSYENTYYAGAIYAAQAALIAEQAAKPGTQNVIILLSDGNATAKENYPTTSFNCNGTAYAAGAFAPGCNDMVVGTQSTKIATSTGTYPSWVGECSQGVDAANYAKTYPGDSSNATKFYTIAYGSPASSNSTNCGSDRTTGSTHKNITPCQAMQQMATSTSTFFSDYYLPGSDTGCQASGPNNTITSLSNIFKTIAYDLTAVRLIPNGMATTTP
jgi:Flp pilus assembly protein TadG